MRTILENKDIRQAYRRMSLLHLSKLEGFIPSYLPNSLLDFFIT